MARVVGSYITEINSTTALSNTGWGPGAIPAQSIGAFTGFSDFILVANMEDQNQMSCIQLTCQDLHSESF